MKQEFCKSIIQLFRRFPLRRPLDRVQSLKPMWRLASEHARSARTFSSVPALLQGKSLEQIQRRLDVLKAFQARLQWPPISEFTAFGRTHPLPLSHCKPGSAEVPLQRFKYLAGFFDGDGCVSVKRKSMSQPNLTVSQAVSNTEILWQLREAFGGGIYINRHGCGLRQPSLQWSVTGEACRHAAAKLVCYSFAKRAQLKLAVDWPAGCNEREEAIRELARLKLQDCNEDIECSWPYLAGFVDAEGSICIRPAQASGQLTIGQKHGSILKWIQRFLHSECSGQASLSRNHLGTHVLSVWAQVDLRVVLLRLLESGLLAKREQSQAALKLNKASHAALRDGQMLLSGNQARYRRLDAAGCERAREIRKLSTRFCYLRARGQPVPFAAHLNHLRQQHLLLNAAHAHTALRADIRSLMAQGAVLVGRGSSVKQNVVQLVLLLTQMLEPTEPVLL